MTKKYEFTGETQIVNGVTFKRIRRISDGLIGGWIEKEENLSHESACFVHGDALVYEDARVYGKAQVLGKAQVCGNELVSGKEMIHEL